MDIDCMTGNDRIIMELNAGDTLTVQFETVKGSIYIEIKETDGCSLYAGNGMVHIPSMWKRITPKERFTFSGWMERKSGAVDDAAFDLLATREETS